MNKSMNRNKGFTLIELVVVIVLLGILAATAAPKFLDITADANAATMKSLKGSISSASNLFRAKYIVSGESSNEVLVKFNGETTYYAVANGYLSHKGTDAPRYAARPDYALGIQNFVDHDLDVEITYSGTTATFALGGNLGCSITYTDSVAKGTPPVVSENLDDCIN